MEPIPERIKEFLAKHIPSIGVLEILFLFYMEPEKESSALEVSKVCRMEVASVATRLEYLVSTELLTTREVLGRRVYRYGPSTVDLADTVAELSRWYSSHRVAITALIFSSPSDLVRPPRTADGSRGRRN